MTRAGGPPARRFPGPCEVVALLWLGAVLGWYFVVHGRLYLRAALALLRYAP